MKSFVTITTDISQTDIEKKIENIISKVNTKSHAEQIIKIYN